MCVCLLKLIYLKTTNIISWEIPIAPKPNEWNYLVTKERYEITMWKHCLQSLYMRLWAFLSLAPTKNVYSFKHDGVIDATALRFWITIVDLWYYVSTLAKTWIHILICQNHYFTLTPLGNPITMINAKFYVLPFILSVLMSCCQVTHLLKLHTPPQGKTRWIILGNIKLKDNSSKSRNMGL